MNTGSNATTFTCTYSCINTMILYLALKQAFREVDVNNDNSLSIEELRKVFEKQGGLSNRDIQQFLVDADQNGTLSCHIILQ